MGEPTVSVDTASDVDKHGLYALWQHQVEDRRAHDKKRDAFGLRIAHKALDIPEDEGGDEMKVSVDKSTKGLGLKEIIAIGGLFATGVGLWQLPAIIAAFNPDTNTTQPVDNDTLFDMIAGPPKAKP